MPPWQATKPPTVEMRRAGPRGPAAASSRESSLDRGSVDTGLRHVRFLELLEESGWRLKLYGMSLGPEPPPEELIERARILIGRTLPMPAIAEERYGVGFATVHAGEHGDYLLLDWWYAQDTLRHHLFGAPRKPGESQSGKLRYGWPQNVCACIWELAVLWHERNAWYRHVLQDGRGDLEGYLADRLEGTV
ncbi:MAG: isochorismatase [Acidobacteriota bacterium]